jgi:superfamily II DNA/RNA helicase
LSGSTAPCFAALGLPRPLVSALTQRGITTPFPIQTATLPDALAGLDILGRGQTGSGKTLAFGLPLLARIAGTPAAPKRPKALILVPTRELAMQVNDALEPLGRGLCIRMKTVVGGTSFPKQVAALRRGVEVIVATPGRLADLISQGACSLRDVEVTVIDEADHMADMGFLPDVSALLDQVPSEGQRMLFSATLDRDVDTLVQRYLNSPVTHAVAPPSASIETMAHHLLLVSPHEKIAVTAEIASRAGRTIMFVRTKHGVDRIAKQLAQAGVRSGALHGGKSQAVRTRTLAEFREGTTPLLIATDVAARGIHVDAVSLVVHVDPPADSKDYLHRAGRTARAGEAGTVVTLVLPHQRRSTAALIQRAGVSPDETRVAAGGAELVRLTGARPPSGVPVRAPAQTPTDAAARPARGARRAGPKHSADAGADSAGRTRPKRPAARTERGPAAGTDSRRSAAGTERGRPAAGTDSRRSAVRSDRRSGQPERWASKRRRPHRGRTAA